MPTKRKVEIGNSTSEVASTPKRQTSFLSETSAALEQDAAKVSPKKELDKSRTIRAAAAKALRDNFLRRGWGEDSLVMIKIDGKSITDFVMEAKEKQKRGQFVIGKYFYQDLKN